MDTQGRTQKKTHMHAFKMLVPMLLPGNLPLEAPASHRAFPSLTERNHAKKGDMAQKVGELTQMWVIVNSGWTGGGSSRVTFLDWF